MSNIHAPNADTEVEGRGLFLADAEFLSQYYESESNPVKMVCMESIVE